MVSLASSLSLSLSVLLSGYHTQCAYLLGRPALP